MLKVPRLSPGVRARVVTGEGVLIMSGDGCRVLIDPISEHLIPALSRGCTTEQIAEELAPSFPLEQTYFALQRLEQDGYICERSSRINESAAAFWASAGLPMDEVTTNLASGRIKIRAMGRVRPEPFERAIHRSGLRKGGAVRLELVLTDDYLRPELADINAKAAKTGTPWMLFKPTGREIWLGPLFVPGEGSCWECLAFRLRAGRYLAEYGKSSDGAAEIRTGLEEIPSSIAIAAHLAAVEALKYFAAGRNSPLQNKIVAFDLLDTVTRSHGLTSRPQCVCQKAKRKPNSLPPRPEPVSRPKGFTSDGGHRIHPPSVTLKRYSHHVSPITGIVDGIEPIGNLPQQIAPAQFHVWTAGHNFAFQFKNLRAFAENMRSRSAGKGMTSDQAKAGALAEALERYSAIFHGDEPRKRASFRKLGAAAIHPNACMLFSDRQYELRDPRFDSTDDYHRRIPRRLDDGAAIDWSPIFSLTTKSWRYLPTLYTYFPSQVGNSARKGAPYFYADSNGNASGNVIEEAILHGFLELVERDAVAIWWYNRLRRPGVDLESFNHPFFREFCTTYDRLDREVWLLDITSDVEIPAFAALSRLRNAAREDIVFGFGCHLDPELGISRALTEMNQMLALSFGENEEQGIARGLDKELNEWFRTATTKSEPYLLPATTLPPSRRAKWNYVPSADLLEDIERCKSRVEALGLELLVMDQTRADVGMPSVKVVVPGMRHFWPRFAPGRLYDVPVKLGQMQHPLTEDQLNPRRMFF
jgi:oxazoline/thiazoline synthase